MGADFYLVSVDTKAVLELGWSGWLLYEDKLRMRSYADRPRGDIRELLTGEELAVISATIDPEGDPIGDPYYVACTVITEAWVDKCTGCHIEYLRAEPSKKEARLEIPEIEAGTAWPWLAIRTFGKTEGWDRLLLASDSDELGFLAWYFENDEELIRREGWRFYTVYTKGADVPRGYIEDSPK